MAISRLLARSAVGSLLAAALLTGAAPGSAHASADPGADAADRLAARAASLTLPGELSFSVVDVSSGQVLAARDPDRAQLVASSQKVLTAIAALSTLGPDRLLTTRVLERPGALVLEGGGDPLLSRAQVRSLAAQAASRLGTHSGGPTLPVLVNDGLFGTPTPAPGWVAGYQPWVVAPVRSLALLGDYSWDGSRRVAKAFVSDLRRLGVPARLAGRTDDGAGSIVAQQGHTVAQAVTVMLRKSENNVAEVLYRHVGLAASGRRDWDSARRAVTASLAKRGVPVDGLVLADGSGASRANRVSTHTLTAALRLAARSTDSELRAVYHDGGLPTAGRTGTLGPGYGRFTTAPSRCAAGLIRAKTGTLRDVISLSGVARGPDGHLLAFSLVAGRLPARAVPHSVRVALDGLAATLTGCW